MKMECWMIGKTNEAYLKNGIDEYLKRLKKYISLNWLEISDIKNGGKLNHITLCASEGEKILKNIKNTDTLICLDEKGKTYSSEEFSSKTTYWLNNSHGRIIFLIGGAYGHSPEVKKRANALLSISPMTFTHQMVRLIFIEQLYRAFTIMKGQKYHH